MRLIIDIPNEGYDWIKNGFPDNEDKEFLIKAVKNGIPYEERPQGEWIKHDTWDYSCSICEAMSTVDDGIVKDLPNFCPNCGARMVKNEKN